MCCLCAETDGWMAGTVTQLLLDGEPQQVKVGENVAFAHSWATREAQSDHRYKPSYPPPSNHGSCTSFRAMTVLCNHIRSLPLHSTRHSLPPNRRRWTPVRRISAACCCCRMADQYSGCSCPPPPPLLPSTLAMNFNAAFHSRRTTLTHSLLSSSSTSGADSSLSLIGPWVRERSRQAMQAAPTAYTSIHAGGGPGEWNAHTSTVWVMNGSV